MIGSTIGRVGRVFEWCSGPGFIGFSLLANELCESLCLADINPAAVNACQETIRRNDLHDKVKVFLSDNLRGIPESEKWDLVVSNPPHSGTDELHPEWGPSLIYLDNNWTLHRNFYADVQRFLNPGGSVIIQEFRQLSSVETFRSMIEAGGLRVVSSCECRLDPAYYYLWSAPVSLR